MIKMAAMSLNNKMYLSSVADEQVQLLAGYCIFNVYARTTSKLKACAQILRADGRPSWCWADGKKNKKNVACVS